MGPTNVALVKLFQADQKLREAQGRLEAASKNVRIQERRTAELEQKLTQAQQRLREHQARYGQLDLDLKTRDAHIEKLRTQQQTAHTNKEYQTFLVEINTHKVDKAKIEEETLKAMEQVEKAQGEVKELAALIQAEQGKLAQIRSEIGDKLATLQKEIDSLTPAREEAYQAVPPKGREAFDKLADRWEGESMSALEKPNPREEEYICTACNMSLVVDVYNRLHTRDDLVYCPSCRRILFIPADLTPEAAVHQKKEVKAPRTPRAKKTKVDSKAAGAGAPRQQSAVDVLRSIEVQEDEPAGQTPVADAEPAPETETAPEANTPQPPTENT